MAVTRTFLTYLVKRSDFTIPTLAPLALETKSLTACTLVEVWVNSTETVLTL